MGKAAKETDLSREEKARAKAEAKALKKAQKEAAKAEKLEKAEKPKKKIPENRDGVKSAKNSIGRKTEKTGDKSTSNKKLKERAKERVSGGSRQSIMQTLLLAFMVPVVLMIVLGIVSYNTAASSIISKYNESALSTVSAVGDYCNLVCDSISTKALEIVTNSDLADYYEKYYKTQNTKSTEAFRSSKYIVGNVRSTNKYMGSCSVIPEGGLPLSSMQGSMTSDPYTDFVATPEGSYFAENTTVKNGWLGYHTYLDECMGSSPEKYALVFYQEILKNNTTLVMDIDMTVAMEMLDQMDFGENSIRGLISADGREVISVAGKEGEVPEETYFVGNDFFEATKTATEAGSEDVRLRGKRYVYIYTPVGKTGAMICALIPRSNLLGHVGTIKYITIFMVIIAAGAALTIGGTISSGISKAVKMMTVGLSEVASGDLTRSFETKRKDEFKVLTTALNSMLDSMRILMQDMKQFGTKVTDLSANVSDKTTAINTSMQDVAKAMDEVALGVQSQAADTESSNNRMRSFTDNINGVTDKTHSMTDIADQAINAVEQGKVIVRDLSEKSDTTVSLTKVLVSDIDEVQQSSEEIKSFVDIISSIAEQTNLLSLNASIEAARAGAAGRGFAVVAEEIRKLADQSKESGNQIRSIVENIGATTNKTTASAKKAEGMVNDQAEALEETVKVFGMIQTCVGKLVDGIRAVTESLEKVAIEGGTVQNAIQNISSVSEEVAASTEEVTATLSEQVSVIENLKGEVEVLRTDAGELGKSIERFKI